MMRAVTLALAALALTGPISATASAKSSLEGDRISTAEGDLLVHPVEHGTFVMAWKGHPVYVDPVGGAQRFAPFAPPDLILLTDIHGDHLDVSTLQAVADEDTRIVAPQAVAQKLPESLRTKTTVLANGESASLLGIDVRAVPMYNLTPERLKYHEKGRGNGYVLQLADTRVYVAGDTEDIPEMRSLEDIDVAFVPMNLPYTMTVEQAADAVREFAPDIVYPYHYRGSDVQKFQSLVGKDSGVEVRLREWYPQRAGS